MARQREEHEDHDGDVVAIRRSAEGDFDAWFALFAAVAAEGRWLGAEAPVDPAPRRAFFDRCHAGDDGALFLAEEGGRVVGSISIDFHGGIADIGMAVAGDRRGRGIGSGLLRAALDFAVKRGAHKVSLVVWPHNHAARALYSKFGFTTEGLRRRHYRRRSGALWDAVFMGLVLDDSSPGGPGSERHRPPPPLLPPPEGLAEAGIGLRALTSGDAANLVAAAGDAEMRRWLDQLPEPYELGDAEEFVASARRQMAEGEAAVLAVVEDTPGAAAAAHEVPDGSPRVGISVTASLLGVVELGLDPRDRQSGRLGYWVAAPFRRRGIATTAVRATSRWAFEGLGLRRLEVLCAVDNAASRAVAERAGFELEGIRRAWRSIRGQATDFAAYALVAAAPAATPSLVTGHRGGSDDRPG